MGGKCSELRSLTLGVPAAMASFRMELLLPREKRTGSESQNCCGGQGGSGSRDLTRSNSKAHGSPSLDHQERPRPDWRGMERRAVPAISPAGIKWCYEWNPPNPGTRCRVKSRLLPSSGACTAPLPALGKSGEQACRGPGKKAKERGVEVASCE